MAGGGGERAGVVNQADHLGTKSQPTMSVNSSGQNGQEGKANKAGKHGSFVKAMDAKDKNGQWAGESALAAPHPSTQLLQQ
eukprot:546557-Prorocentrum_minimum.AAC.1